MSASEVLQRFGDLPFTVELEVGSLAMSVGEIFALEEGSVLRTDRPAGAPFTFIAGGVALGEAEVMTVNGALSARIKKLPRPTNAGSSGNAA